MARFLAVSWVLAATAGAATAQIHPAGGSALGSAPLAVAGLATAPPAKGDRSPARDGRLFELRTYYAAPGKLDALHARFRVTAVRLFEKHGMTSVGYWVPADNPDRKVVFLLAYPDRAGRDAAWSRLAADPDWQQAKRASEAGGQLVDRIEERLLSPSDLSPAATAVRAGGDRVFELRTYAVRPADLPAHQARLRSHAVGLLEKHGVANVGHWTAEPDRPGGDVLVVCLLAHRTAAARDRSYTAFWADPAWAAADAAPRPAAGGPDGLLLKPTDYSPLR